MKKISSQTAEFILSDVPIEKRFICKNGKTFLNLNELVDGLKKMNKTIFRYHVNEKKNDFSNWIYDVIGDVSLSENLRKVTDVNTSIKEIKSRVMFLKKI